jgi:hypothetical protein
MVIVPGDKVGFEFPLACRMILDLAARPVAMAVKWLVPTIPDRDGTSV